MTMKIRNSPLFLTPKYFFLKSNLTLEKVGNSLFSGPIFMKLIIPSITFGGLEFANFLTFWILRTVPPNSRNDNRNILKILFLKKLAWISTLKFCQLSLSGSI